MARNVNVSVKMPEWLARWSGRVKPKQVVYFTRQLATLIGAGLPLVKSLYTLYEQLEPGRLRETVGKVAAEVEGGTAFSEALVRYPGVFPPLFIGMVRAGEVGGLLDEILKRLAEFLEKQDRFRSRVRAALMYPLFVMGIALTVLVILMAFVVPTFVKMFGELGGALPLPTQILITTSTVIRRWWPVLAAGLVLTAVAARVALRVPVVRFVVDRWLLRAPVVGRLIHQVAVARFARTLGTLLTSGVPILKALEVVQETVGNLVIRRALEQVHRGLKEGNSVAGPLEASGVFEPIVVRMVAVGEETGSLDKMLTKIGESFEEEVDIAVTGLTALLEPLLIVFLGLVVGFIVISMFLPMFSLAKLIG